MKHFSDDGCNRKPAYDEGLWHEQAKELSEKIARSYDHAAFPPIHIDDDYDSFAEYESGIKHFQD